MMDLIEKLDLLNKAVKNHGKYKNVFYQVKHYILRHVCLTTVRGDFWNVEFCTTKDGRNFFELHIKDYVFHIPKPEFPGVMDWEKDNEKLVEFKPEPKEIDEQDFLQGLDEMMKYYVKIGGLVYDKASIYKPGIYMVTRFYQRLYGTMNVNLKSEAKNGNIYCLDNKVRVFVSGKEVEGKKNLYRLILMAVLDEKV